MVSSDYYIVDNSDLENKRLEAAKNHYVKGDYSSALRLYLDMLNMSTSFKLYYEIGRCYYKLNDLLPAEEYFKKSIGLESFKNPSYLYLGNIFYKREDLKNAIENWVSAYAYKPDDEAVCLNLATSYFSKNMKFQSVFYYEKYLKYAKDRGQSYSTIKNSINRCNEIGKEFMQKAQRAISLRNYSEAIEYLTFAVKNMPVSFDINLALGKAYLEENDNMHAMIFLKQALCLDNKSLDVLQKLASVFINLGDYTAAYCTMRRLLPLVIHNQSEYLRTLQVIKDLNASFDDLSYQGHKEWADRYYEDNNYHMALIEYENCVILKDELQNELGDKIDRIKSFINPETRIIKTCLEKGEALYKEGDFKTSNKYYSKAMLLANENSSDYRLAKSRVVNV